jgi:hypothetical protein
MAYAAALTLPFAIPPADDVGQGFAGFEKFRRGGDQVGVSLGVISCFVFIDACPCRSNYKNVFCNE